MKKKLFLALLTSLCLVGGAFALSACGEHETINPLDGMELDDGAQDGTPEDTTVAVTAVALDKSSATLTIGDTVTLTATVSPTDATDKTVTWTTSDSSVATVSGGVVTAVSTGSATITAKAGDKTATCTVTVENKSVAGKVYSIKSVDVTYSAGYTGYEFDEEDKQQLIDDAEIFFTTDGLWGCGYIDAGGNYSQANGTITADVYNCSMFSAASGTINNDVVTFSLVYGSGTDYATLAFTCQNARADKSMVTTLNGNRYDAADIQATVDSNGNALTDEQIATLKSYMSGYSFGFDSEEKQLEWSFMGNSLTAEYTIEGNEFSFEVASGPDTTTTLSGKVLDRRIVLKLNVSLDANTTVPVTLTCVYMGKYTPASAPDVAGFAYNFVHSDFEYDRDFDLSEASEETQRNITSMVTAIQNGSAFGGSYIAFTDTTIDFRYNDSDHVSTYTQDGYTITPASSLMSSMGVTDEKYELDNNGNLTVTFSMPMGAVSMGTSGTETTTSVIVGEVTIIYNLNAGSGTISGGSPDSGSPDDSSSSYDGWTVTDTSVSNYFYYRLYNSITSVMNYADAVGNCELVMQKADGKTIFIGCVKESDYNLNKITIDGTTYYFKIVLNSTTTATLYIYRNSNDTWSYTTKTFTDIVFNGEDGTHTYIAEDQAFAFMQDIIDGGLDDFISGYFTSKDDGATIQVTEKLYNTALPESVTYGENFTITYKYEQAGDELVDVKTEFNSIASSATNNGTEPDNG